MAERRLDIDIQAAENARGRVGVTNPYLYVKRERLEALEEIRQRVADGFRAWKGDDKPLWILSRDPWRADPLSPEVAAVLWPSTEEET